MSLSGTHQDAEINQEQLVAAFHGGSIVVRVERIDTHLSRVFLTGDRALKLKRAVRLPFVDFTTIEWRRAACDAELKANRRFAPTLCLGVLSITRNDNRYTPFAVATVAEAIARTLALAPDLIVLDVGARGTDRQDILKPLTGDERTKSIATIVLTSNCSEHASCAGCEHFITKPIALNDLMTAVHDIEVRALVGVPAPNDDVASELPAHCRGAGRMLVSFR